MRERTFVMIKPDGVQRGLIGECIKRIEQTGLKIIAMKMLKPSPELIEKHYPSSDEWFSTVGQKTTTSFNEEGKNIQAKFGTTEPIAIGKQIKEWLKRFLSSGPVVVMIVEGNRAISNIRKIVGVTDAVKSEAGSIRGAFSIDNASSGNVLNRPILNIVHASEDAKEADNEIKLWFTEQEIIDYKRCDEDFFYNKW